MAMVAPDGTPLSGNEVSWEWSFEQAWVGSYWIRNMKISEVEWEWTVICADEAKDSITLKGHAHTREEAREQAISAAKRSDSA